MYCKKCGYKLEEDAKVCPFCNHKVDEEIVKYEEKQIVKEETIGNNDNGLVNYEKIDMDKLREIEHEIEGQADIYKNNKLMLKTWWEFSKDMGMTCKGV